MTDKHRPENGKRVVVTGMGLVTPLGTGLEKTWDNLIGGKSGIKPISLFDASGLTTRIAGEVRDFETEAFFDRKEARRLDRSQQFAVAASAMALEDGAFTVDPREAERVAVIIGSAVGGLNTAYSESQKVLARGPKAMAPLFILHILPSMAPAIVAIRFGIKGPNWSTNSACATSAHAVGEAARMIQREEAVAVLAGGTEAPIGVMGMGGFCALRALSRRNDDPEGASRPFDRDRDGFVLSEGAAILLLEELTHAIARGARIYGELVGYGATADAHHLTVPAPDKAGTLRCMRLALREASLSPGEVGYVNAHATATDIGDRAEAEALQEVFLEENPGLLVSSTKSMTGHLTGAGGGAEAAFSLLAMNRGVVPPTINLVTPDEGVVLDLVPNRAREAELDIVMTNSFGFGGTNVSLVFRKVLESQV